MSRTIEQVKGNICKVILGKDIVIERVLLSLICRGHLLIEDVPGLGKTILARSLAKSIKCKTKRLQFTPDMLPSDITGVSIFDQGKQQFRFVPGPIFTHLLLADEINRTSPRTQSALLEAMEEHQVSVDGVSRKLPDLFMVIATQNPVEQSGTYPLPEAQLDRFFMKISVGYPSPETEVSIIGAQQTEHPINTLEAVTTGEEILTLQREVSQVTLAHSLKEYIVAICVGTRKHPLVKLGVSPRGSLALARASQGLALIRGKLYVDPTLIKEIAESVLSHRLLLTPEARVQKVTEKGILREVIEQTPVPVFK